MKVCSKCGARIYVDRQNCTICGAPLIEATQQNQQEQQNQQIQHNQQELQNQQNQQTLQNLQFQSNQQNRQEQQNQRRTVYDGDIHKCPSCGEVLNSFVAMCPVCGYEVRGARTSNFVSEFSLKLSQMSSDEEKSNLIRNFPIPNSKEDIHELLILASTNIGGSLALNVSEAWVVKVDQCYQKATLILGNDYVLTNIKQIYDECHKKFKKVQRKYNREQRAKRAQENRIASQTSASVPVPTVSTPVVPTPAMPVANVPTPTISASGASTSNVPTPNSSNIILNISVPSTPAAAQPNSLPPTPALAPRSPVREVKVPRAVKNGLESNYAAVEALFVQAGFTNVKTIPLNDLFLGIMSTPGEIEKITIDGKELSSYIRRTFNSDVPVMITYHSRRI